MDRERDPTIGTVSLGAFFASIRRAAPSVIVATLLATGLVALLVVQVPAHYRAEAVLIIKPHPVAQPSESQPPASPLDISDAEAASFVDAIASVPVLDRVVSRLQLEEDPEFNPELRVETAASGENGLIGHLRHFVVSVIARIQGFLKPTAFEDTRLATIAKVSGTISVTVKASTRTISVQATARDPRKAAAIANAVADSALQRDVADKIGEAGRVEVWLAQRLGELKERVSRSEEESERLRTETGRFEGQSAAIVAEQLSQVSRELLEARVQLAAAEAKRDAVARLRAQPTGTARSDDVLGSPTVQSLRAQESALSANLAAAESKLGPKHPYTISLRSQLAAVEARLAAETNRIGQTWADRTGILESEVVELEHSQKELESQIEKQRTSSGRLKELEREADGDRATYQAFAIFRAKTAGLSQVERSSLQLVSPAVPSSLPVWPNRLKVILVTAIGTLGIGFLVPVLRASFDQGLRNAEQVAALLGLQTAAVLPSAPGRWWRRRDPTRTALDVPGSPLHESIRHLYAVIAAARAGRQRFKVLISSALPGEGKTTTSLMLAREASLAGVKTLLVCLDLRRAERAAQDAVSGSALMHTDIEGGLSVLQVRTPRRDSFKILYRSSFWKELQAVCRNYEFVIIDSPPILSVSDAKIIAHFADMTVLVVKWGTTSVAAATEALRQLRSIGAEARWAVLTQVNPRQKLEYGGGEAAFGSRRYGSYSVKV